MSASTSSALDLRSTQLPADEDGGPTKVTERRDGTRGRDAIAQRDVHDGAESDARLMQRYGTGDHEAFQLLYCRYRGPLLRFITRLVGNSDEANEIFQEVWTAVIHGRRSYRPTAKFSTYLFSVAHRRLRDRQRRYSRWLSAFRDAEPPPTPEEVVDDRVTLPEIGIHGEQLRRALHAAIDSLPPPQREVFLLKAENAMSLEEIAVATGAKLEATKSRLRYAVARLRAQLRSWK
jgi:RNA polymerase sigma-70 factor (ECF subfamily)